METTGSGGHLVGRERELAVLAEHLASDAASNAKPTGLVLLGEPGIGKTSLWEAGVAHARQRDVRVLAARPGDADAGLSFTGLADLLDGVRSEEVAELPAPQRHALEVALLRAEPGGAPVERRAVSAAFLNALRLLGARRRLLVAIDDVPSLDAPSVEAVAFAARRLRDAQVSFLLSRRRGSRSPVERALDPPGPMRLELGPLSLGAVRAMLSQRLGLTLPRRALLRLVETVQGNPLYALELGRTLVERGGLETGVELPVPDVVDDLFAERLLGSPAEARRVLLAVALSGGLRPSEISALADASAVEDAVASGLLVLDDERVRPSHPLLAAAARRHSSARERRLVHRALAQVARDEVLRARHLALAARTADPDLADSVSSAAAAAVARGAMEEAIELAEHALRLTPREDPRHPERLLALAEYLEIAGEPARVVELLGERVDHLLAGRMRARACLLLGEAAPDHETHQDLLSHALAESEGEPDLRAIALATRVILSTCDRVARLPEAQAWADEALAEARSAGRTHERRALHALAWVRILRGLPVDDLVHGAPSMLDRGYLYETSIDRPAAVRLAFRGQVEEARAAFVRLQALADERGEGRFEAVLHLQRCEIELRAGDCHAAAALLDEWNERTAMEDMGFERARIEALLAAVRGLDEDAARWAADAIARSGLGESGWDGLEALRARGIAALLGREPGRAVENLGAVWEHTRREGVEDPGAFPVAPDLVEGLVELERLDEAAAVTARLGELAEAQDHPWGLATAGRCDALIRLASPAPDDAAAADLEAAAVSYAALGLRFDQARSLLALGRALRRRKRWAAARRALEESAELFQANGSTGWAKQARAETHRVGARRPGRKGDLTPAEERAVALAARGLSNKEIARALFVSVHTVEVHLSHAYAKLGVRSRAQLVRALAEPG